MKCSRCRVNQADVPDRRQCSSCLESGRKYTNTRRRVNLARDNAYQREQYRKHSAKRIIYQKTKAYGITAEQYRQLVSSGVCGICGQRRKLTVDHNHKTGVVRGALCHQCNMALGLFGDSAVVLKAAVSYLFTYGDGPKKDGAP